MFPFFADAANLARITPPAMRFAIRSPLPIVMGAGTLIDYRLRILGLPARWRTLISTWDPPNVFVDEQLRGPYSMWVHTHHFEATGGATRMTDEVRFRLPLGWLGLVPAPLVARQLRAIFGYRATVIATLFPPERD